MNADSQLLYSLWAKTNERDAAGEPWSRHPLPCHLLDVGHAAEAWLDADTGLLGRFCALWPGLSETHIRRVVVLAAALHDLGKVYPAFQAKSPDGWRHGYGAVWGAQPIPNGVGFDHGAGTARLFDLFFGSKLSWSVDPAWEPFVDLMRVAAGHHGRLYSADFIGAFTSLTPYVLGGQTACALLAEVEALLGPPPAVSAPPPADFLMLLAGFVSVADWIGSDSAFFPFAPQVVDRASAADYLEGLRAASVAHEEGSAWDALHRAGLIASFDDVERSFAEMFAFAPRPGFQADAVAVPFGAAPGPEIAVVEAPMGLGKTEIALYLTARALRAGNASGLYFALPTQASSNALFVRVRAFADVVKGETDLALTLAHGARSYYAEFRALLDRARRFPFTQTTHGAADDAAPPSEVVASTWLHPAKRALLAPVGLGTIDQAMLGAMGAKHGFVRLFALARKVVVFDEIHAYDGYMNAVIVRLLEWLRVLGAKSILLSATLPQHLRRELLGAYGVTEPVDAAPEHSPYPQLLHGSEGSSATRVTDPMPPEGRPRTDVHVEVITSDDATAAGVAWVRAQAARGGCIAWIRNTVREAQAAHAALAAAGIASTLLHARFTRSDRNAKEEALLAAYGAPTREGVARPDRGVVVATQVIEQSVDVDFDAMLSDLAPVDLLLQRAGRLWRHTRAHPDNRPTRGGHVAPVLTVLMPGLTSRAALDFGLSAYVYDADTLARSAVLVQEYPVWTLPTACRALVAALYDHEPDWTADRLGCPIDTLAAVRQRAERAQARMRHAAKTTLVSRPGVVPEMRDARRDDGGDEVGVVMATRYGGASAAFALFVDAPGGPVPLSTAGPAPRPLAIPPAGNYRARLAAEEAVALTSVAFPWYQDAEALPHSPALAAFAAWWRETHPFDSRRFLLLGADGRCALPALDVRYSLAAGLQLTRQAPPSDSAPFEAL